MTVNGVAIGQCCYGSEVGLKDYSRKERDEFGDITLIQRGYTDVVTFKVEIATADAAVVRNLLASLRAVKATYTGTAVLSVLTVEGYLNDFSITLRDWATSDLSLSVESEVHG